MQGAKADTPPLPLLKSAAAITIIIVYDVIVDKKLLAFIPSSSSRETLSRDKSNYSTIPRGIRKSAVCSSSLSSFSQTWLSKSKRGRAAALCGYKFINLG